MSDAERPAGDHPDRPTGRASPQGRRRGRLFIPLGILAAIVLVFAFIVLVSRCSPDANAAVSRAGGNGAPVAVRDVPVR
jgi:hypothetical protein